MRFTVLDAFGAPIRKFATRAEAQAFIKNKPDCTIREVSLFEILGEALL